MSTEATAHLLFCAFAEVPGASAAGTRLHQLVKAFSGSFDIDALSLRGPEQQHIERLEGARVMRVPVEGKSFAERLAAYQRALTRQLASDTYPLVFCADVFSAQVASAFKDAQGFALFVEVADLPSSSFARRWPVAAADKRLRAALREGEQQVLRVATKVLAPSRHAARLLSERTDPRRVELWPRAVDLGVFSPPSVELSLDDRRTVLVVGGCEGPPGAAVALPLLTALAAALPAERTSLRLAGAPGAGGGALGEALEAAGLSGRVSLLDIDEPARLAGALCAADVVVVPSRAEQGVEPWAVPFRALEAMACQRAVVLTGPNEVFADALVAGEDALVVPERQPAAVVAAVERLLSSPALRASVAQAGQRRAEQQADLDLRLEHLLRLFTAALGGTTLRARPAEATAPAERPNGAAAETVAALASVSPGDSGGAFAPLPGPPNNTARAAPAPPAEGEALDGLLSEEAGALFDGAFDPSSTTLEDGPVGASARFSDGVEAVSLASPAPAPARTAPPRAAPPRAAPPRAAPPRAAPSRAAPPRAAPLPGGAPAVLEANDASVTVVQPRDALTGELPTRVAAPPSGFVSAFQDDDEDGAWRGKPYVERDDPLHGGAGSHQDTDRIPPAPSTSSMSRPMVRAGIGDTVVREGPLPQLEALSATDASDEEGGPWAPDTIADASPFLDEVGRRGGDDTERSGGVRTARSGSLPRAPGSLLVDSARCGEPDLTLEDAPVARSSSEE